MSPLPWFRWHVGTVTDIKWHVIATRAETSIANVLAVWTCLLEDAAQAEQRGTVESWCAEDIAAYLGLDQPVVNRIWGAMQGKVLDGQQLTGWNKRQPLREREDYSTERVRRHRVSKDEVVVTPPETPVTPRNTQERQETPRVEESRVEEITTTTSRATHSKDTEDFEACWSIYPKRSGGNPRQVAIKSYLARRRAGVPHEELLAGARRYSAYCNTSEKTGTEFVMQGGRFFGSSEPFREAWDIPATNGAGRNGPRLHIADRVSETIAKIVSGEIVA